MSLTYTLSLDDLLAFNAHLLHHVASFRRFLVRTRIAVGTGALIAGLATAYVLIYVFNGDRSAFPYMVGFMVIGSAAIVYGFPKRIEQVMQEKATQSYNEGQQNGENQQHTLAVEPEAVSYSSPKGDRQLAWTAITNVDVTDQHVFLFFSRTQAIIVPKAAFANGNDRDAFVQQVQGYHAAARQHLAA